MSSAKPGVKRMSVTSAFTTEADAQLASMMHIQACCRRFVVLARVKRAKRAQEVARRKRRLQSSLSDADFVVGTQLLELFATADANADDVELLRWRGWASVAAVRHRGCGMLILLREAHLSVLLGALVVDFGVLRLDASEQVHVHGR